MTANPVAFYPSATAPVATSSTPGIVQPDGTTIDDSSKLTKKGTMKKFLSSIVLFAASCLGMYAQQPVPTQAGQTYVASQYSYLSNVTTANATGSSSVKVAPAGATSSKGQPFVPFNANSPVVFDQGNSNAETITPTSVTNCYAGSINCTVAGSFSYVHTSGAPVQSGTFGLQEAIDQAIVNGSGTVLIDSTWQGPSGSSLITSATGSVTVTIQDNRSGSPINYQFNGSAYVEVLNQPSTGTRVANTYPGVDIGDQINHAFGTNSGGTPVCTAVTIRPGTYNYSTTITIPLPCESLIGPTVGAAVLHYTGSGDGILWQMNPFTNNKAGQISDFTLTGTSAAANGIHTGTLVGGSIARIFVDDFNGESANGILLENINACTGYSGGTCTGHIQSWTERIHMDDVQIGGAVTNGNTIGLHFTVNGGSNSFAYGDYNVWGQTNSATQVLTQIDHGAVVYNQKRFDMQANVYAAGSDTFTVTATNGSPTLTITGGPLGRLTIPTASNLTNFTGSTVGGVAYTISTYTAGSSTVTLSANYAGTSGSVAFVVPATSPVIDITPSQLLVVNGLIRGASHLNVVGEGPCSGQMVNVGSTGKINANGMFSVNCNRYAMDTDQGTATFGIGSLATVLNNNSAFDALEWAPDYNPLIQNQSGSYPVQVGQYTAGPVTYNSFFGSGSQAFAWYGSSTGRNADGTVAVAPTELGYFLSAGGFKTQTYDTFGNCSSAASPAVCSTDSAGSVTVAAGATTVVVDTTAVSATSQIQLTFDSSLSAKLGVTCNTTFEIPYVSARVAGTSFTVSLLSTETTNPACISYNITN